MKRFIAWWKPHRFELPEEGSTARRDGLRRQSVQDVFAVARDNGCGSVSLDVLDFEGDIRPSGRENPKQRRGKPGKKTRGRVMAMPTSRLPRMFAEMAPKQGLPVVGVDPAYTTKHGRKWLPELKESHHRKTTVHDASAFCGGRRMQGLPLERKVGAAVVTQRNTRSEQSPSTSARAGRECENPHDSLHPQDRPDPEGHESASGKAAVEAVCLSGDGVCPAHPYRWGMRSGEAELDSDTPKVGDGLSSIQH